MEKIIKRMKYPDAPTFEKQISKSSDVTEFN